MQAVRAGGARELPSFAVCQLLPLLSLLSTREAADCRASAVFSNFEKDLSFTTCRQPPKALINIRVAHADEDAERIAWITITICTDKPFEQIPGFQNPAKGPANKKTGLVFCSSPHMHASVCFLSCSSLHTSASFSFPSFSTLKSANPAADSKSSSMTEDDTRRPNRKATEILSKKLQDELFNFNQERNRCLFTANGAVDLAVQRVFWAPRRHAVQPGGTSYVVTLLSSTK